MLLKFKDYERIYRVINSIVKSEGGDPSGSCAFFGVFGAYILNNHYGLSALPKAGLAAYHIGADKAVVFGEKVEDGITGANQAYHCWVEANGWVIDFMAPAFPQLDVLEEPISSKMFQKPIDSMGSSLIDLKKAGDFFLHSTPDSTEKHLKFMSTHLLYKDLAEICLIWYVKPSKKIKSSIKVDDKKGNQKTIQLTGNRVEGTW